MEKIIFLLIFLIINNYYIKSQIDSLDGFDEHHAWEHTLHLKNEDERKKFF